MLKTRLFQLTIHPGFPGLLEVHRTWDSSGVVLPHLCVGQTAVPQNARSLPGTFGIILCVEIIWDYSVYSPYTA